MVRDVLFKWLCVSVVLVGWLAYGVACDPAPVTEKPEVKDSAPVETGPEPTITESAPDGLTQPDGVGNKCRRGPDPGQGDCPNKRLVCGPISRTEAYCYENCTETKKCALADEQCVTVEAFPQIPVCVKVAKKGEECGLEKRIICPGEAVDPPLYCLSGKCTEKPKDGWDVGQPCTAPRGDQQSDCKAGLLCVQYAQNRFICAKKCDKDGDCSGSEICWEKPFSVKACVIPVKAGEKCNPLERRFCKTDNPLSPLECNASGVCESTSDVKQLGEVCTKSVVPGQERGNCDQGMLCLGVSDREARCHKSCTNPGDCPSGEGCVQHPNPGPGDPIKACVIQVGDGEVCDLQKRKMCKQEANKFFKCKKPDDTKTEGKCVEINIGDGCVNDGDCGSMICVAVDSNQPASKYCLLPCDPKTPKCPGNGACQGFGQNGPFACLPTGPNKAAEPCKALQAGGQALNTTTLCVGGLACVTFQQGNPAGVCMKSVAQCNATACESGYVCLPTQNSGFCGLDCSTNASVCKPGTKCVEITQLKAKVCGPT